MSYTYAEQLLKKTIYECLDYSRCKNHHINLFMKNKIDPNRFSPNPVFNNFKKELKNLTDDESYNFLLKSGNSNFKIYDDMIKFRHEYAHANRYSDYKQYKDSIKVLDYLTWECEKYLDKGNWTKQRDLVKEFNEIIELTNKLKNLSGDRLLRGIEISDTLGIDVLEFRTKVKKYYSKNTKYFEGVELLKNINTHLKKISELNFNQNSVKDLREICITFSEEYNPG